MNCWLEFHDSSVGQVISIGATVKLVLSSAYLHKSEGRPGFDAGTGWRQAGAIEFGAASVVEVGDIGDGWIIDGSLELASGEVLRGLPVPFDIPGKLKAVFVFLNGNVLAIEAMGVRLVLTGEPRFVEVVPGDET